MKWMDKFKKWAAEPKTPLINLNNGVIADVLKAERAIIVVFDSNGKAYQAINATLSNSTLCRLDNPRQQLADLLDSYNFPEDDPEPPTATFRY